MAGMRYEFESVLVPWDARRELWVFAHVPVEIAEELDDAPLPRGGFNSIKVTATLGSSRWSTSIFPENNGTYALAIKKAIRTHEGVDLGDTVRIGIETEL
ncbi:DUF1905 domain-containing protein [Planctomonas sp. JC2975]|uniref:DUF1905 domain-containing protein n=1 Tax=Planctomonas sp. JC2975 TaxID=2729626 RepID=UPI00147274A4|nr:DUF1905 domain-containing protein [Planctomonas sp. JC2975]NNC13512.1 DUF1905 domain-containing protein [Planctomonas sp. JC2975]